VKEFHIFGAYELKSCEHAFFICEIDCLPHQESTISNINARRWQDLDIDLLVRSAPWCHSKFESDKF
jgi:hypothetical protein